MSDAARASRAKASTVWCMATTISALLALFGFREQFLKEGMVELGLIFAGYVLAMGVIAGRGKDVCTLLVVLWGGTMGFWCFRWSDLCAAAVHRFLPAAGVTSPAALESLELPVAIAMGGAVSAALLLVATRSGNVAWACLGASLAAAAVPLATSDTELLPWVAVAWHAATAAALGVWAADRAVNNAIARCRTCGEEIFGTSSSLCQRCVAVIRRAGNTPLTAVFGAHRQP
ncbi:MAG: hypothetical protein AMXMBFR58_13330 [Phycisphaerae bacterium]|nr:hypothetical protein [Phycisphaerales bacterium]